MNVYKNKIKHVLGVSTFTFDQFNNIVVRKFFHGNVYLYEYDQFGNQIKKTFPSGRSRTFEYDKFGNRV